MLLYAWITECRCVLLKWGGVWEISSASMCVWWPLPRTSLYALGLISKTKQGCELLKQQGWDAVRHSRRQLWPVVPDEAEQQLSSELSSVPSTLSLNSESTSSRHNSESESSHPSESSCAKHQVT